MARRRDVESVRSPRDMARCGVFATSQGQRLDLPIRAEGLSEVTIANGQLHLSPDYDLFSLLCERWLARPTETGWMRPTFYELANALYGDNGPPGGKHYRDIRDALDRLAELSISIWGFDAATGKADHNYVTKGHLLGISRETHEPHGLRRPRIRLDEWLREVIDHGAVIRLDWRTLRSFDRNQQLAKRLWIYLQAESWKPQDKEIEGTWLAIGDRLFSSLSMSYAQPKQARAALKRAGEALVATDPRYQSVSVVKRSKGIYHLVARRLRTGAWHKFKRERREARKTLRSSLGLEQGHKGSGGPISP
jgi:hypothetical protein